MAQRNSQQTKAKILKAVGELLARDGFQGLGINAVARAAGVDKVLIYRYFGGFSELLRAYGKSGDFWPDVTELTGGDVAALKGLPAGEAFSEVMNNYLNAILRRPNTMEILAWEMIEQSELARVLAEERERVAAHLMEMFSGAWLEYVDLAAVIAVLGAAANYLAVRSRNYRTFSGVDLTTRAGWRRIEKAMGALIGGVIAERQ